MKDIKFIADIGSNHNGSINRIKQMIKELSELNFWGVKFQIFDESIYNDKILKEEIKKNILPLEFLPKIRKYCDKYNLKLGATPFYNKAVSLIKPHVDFIKISSFDSERKILLDLCLKANKQLMVSFGLSKDNIISDLNREIYFGSENKNNVFMHCVSSYPAKVKHAALQRITKIKNTINSNAHVGYSDHTVNENVILGSIINGAEYIELHYDIMDSLGSETIHGHCWNYRKFKKLNNTLKEIKLANSKKFFCNKEMLKLKANENGVRDE